MQRRWQVHPDETGVVSREALIGAFIDAAALLDIAGGCLSVVTGRAPTALDGEMVMTGAIFEWRDRTDAKPQPEAPSTVGAAEAEASQPTIFEQRMEEAGLEDAAASLNVEVGPPSGENPDGFKYERLEAEDVEEPEPVR